MNKLFPKILFLREKDSLAIVYQTHIEHCNSFIILHLEILRLFNRQKLQSWLFNFGSSFMSHRQDASSFFRKNRCVFIRRIMFQSTPFKIAYARPGNFLEMFHLQQRFTQTLVLERLLPYSFVAVWSLHFITIYFHD